MDMERGNDWHFVLLFFLKIYFFSLMYIFFLFWNFYIFFTIIVLTTLNIIPDDEPKGQSELIY